jgi:hypothetical protein
MKKQETSFAVWSSYGAASSDFLFVIAVILNWEMTAYVSSMGIAVFYLALTVANETHSSGLYARLATVLASIYATLVLAVYYVQLSYLRLGSPGPEATHMLSYQHAGSALFAVDLLGYGLMSLSIVCLGKSIQEKVLQRLLVGLGLFGAPCIVVPLLPFFYDSSKESSDATGVIALTVWGVLFFPVMILAGRYYRQIEKLD